MAITATASEYAEYLKEKDKDLSGVSQWEKYFLQPTQQAFESAVQTEQQRAAYDISGAYNAYKQQQMQLMQQNLFSEGVKERQLKALESSYDTAVSQTSQQQAQNLATIQEKYSDTMRAAESDLLAQGEKVRQIEEKLIEFGESFGKDMSDVYRNIGDERVLTRYGASLYSDLMKEGIQGQYFEDYLGESSPELREFLINQGKDISRYLGSAGETKEEAKEYYSEIAKKRPEYRADKYWTSGWTGKRNAYGKQAFENFDAFAKELNISVKDFDYRSALESVQEKKATSGGWDMTASVEYIIDRMIEASINKYGK